MTQQSDSSEAQPVLPALKVVEQEVDPDDPWHDDVLEREEIAKRLTSIVRGQEAPFVISLDGRWGTGKTFLLKRWAQDLRNQGFEAIYFNAWEDDFNNDPLLAIVGQLSEHFDEGVPDRIARTLAHAALNIVAKRLAGMKVDELTPERLLDDYHEQQRTKRAVKDGLAQLGHRVRDDTGQPLVFIIDELDRCRPTFAIELLERVKHIFDVPNIVFVFGINRGELMKSLESVYGEIDSGTYLRRFFDMEFVLPDAPPLVFCRFLVPKYGLDVFFDDLSRQARKPHSRELSMIVDSLAAILEGMGLALRDMDYCMRLLSLAARKLPEGHTLNPPLFALLAATKIGNPELYRRFVGGEARGAELINFMNERLRLHWSTDDSYIAMREKAEILARVEAAAYVADDPEIVHAQLVNLIGGHPLNHPEYISSATVRLNPSVEADSKHLHSTESFVSAWSREEERAPRLIRGELAQLIDLYSDFARP